MYFVILFPVDPDRKCPIDNTCEQLCALEIISGSGSGDVTVDEVCSCTNRFVLDENMENCTGECLCVCVCALIIYCVSALVC